MVSVIVPVYYGRNYIKNIIGMVERNARSADELVEIVFVNDSCEDTILDLCASSRLNLIVLDNARNRGIHYSRIRGIQHSHGEYILMLDQDDRISDDFLSSQLAKIKRADMVVANGYEEMGDGKRMLYRYAPMQWTVKHGIFYTVFGSRILSPGQCLIRRTSIPDIWFETIINNNGADDYLLWIYMLHKRNKIKINRNRLYIHRMYGKNASCDIDRMNRSLLEVVALAKENHALSLQAYRYIVGGVEGRESVFRKIVDGIVKIGNVVNRGAG